MFCSALNCASKSKSYAMEQNHTRAEHQDAFLFIQRANLTTPWIYRLLAKLPNSELCVPFLGVNMCACEAVGGGSCHPNVCGVCMW